MSQENVEALKRAFDASNRRDIEGLLAVVHPDVEWQSGVETESPVAWVVDFKDGKAIHAKAYLEPSHALEAAGLSE